VRIGPSNECRIGINPDWSAASTLAHIITSLTGACGHRFRGSWYPRCPGHQHQATAEADDDDGVVVLPCPDTGHVVHGLMPDLDPT